MVSNSPEKRALEFRMKNHFNLIARYIVVGTIASIVYITVPMLALSGGIDKHHAIWLGLAGAAIISYTAHLRYTFRVEDSVGTLIKYLVLLTINYLFFSWMVDIISKIHEDKYLQIFFAGILSIGVSFILSSLLVFRKINFSRSIEGKKYGT